MGGMDFSDVGYDAFLINGKRDSQLSDARPGEKVRIRIINAGASSYFHVALGREPMTVISTDGVDIEPTQAKELLLGMAETYDILFTVPDKKNYELRATAQDGTGSASAWIGSGEKVTAPIKTRPDLYASMDHSAHSGHTGHSVHGEHASHNAAIETLTVDDVMAVDETTFPAEKKIHNVKLVLGGDMRRYVWHVNNKAIHEERTIEIQEGDVVRFTFENQTMMHHPMHLHGHFFRVLNQHG
jgi:FtsP/CotA-like multicopper oxidase with cupredoxin domain